MMREIEEWAEKYHNITKKALEKVSIKKNLSGQDAENAGKLLSMANDYFNDACYFEKQGKFVLAIAAFSYAHAWIDAGVKIGLFDGKNDSKLFTLP